MPRRRTGKSPGRPKGEPYTTLLARVPQKLVDRVKAYADLYDLSVSELIRDGLEWRISEGDPRGQRVYDRNTPHAAVAHAAEEDSCNTSREPYVTNGTRISALSTRGSTAPSNVPDAPLPFDATKYKLGKLCPRKHAHGTTGQSLLYIRNDRCIQCDNESARERRREKRLARANG